MIRSIPSIRFGLMVGIGGGIPAPGNDIRLGDVIVSKPEGNVGGVVQYDLGKSTSHGFLRTGFLNGPPESLLRAVTSLRSDHNLVGTSIPDIIEDTSAKLRASEHNYQYPGPERDHLFQTHYDHKTGLDCSACDSAMRTGRIERQEPDMPKIHYGLIASGDRVMKNAAQREDLAAKLEGDVGAKCLCFEMEAAGLMNSFPCLVIRGISDYSDSHKNNEWQPYAAMTAAAYAKELLGELSVEAVAETPKVTKEVLEAVKQVDENVQRMSSVVERVIQSSDLDKIRNWLKAPEPSINYKDADEARYDNTGEWLLSHQAMKDFKTGDSRLIWLHGSSGTGKTILAAAVIRDLKLSLTQASIVLYFFFDFRNDTKQSLDGLLRSLLDQILIEKCEPSAKAVINELFQNHRSGQPLTKDLTETLNHAIAELSGVHLILDALDECPQDKRIEVLQWIRDQLMRVPGGRSNVKIFVTSRSGQQDIQKNLESLLVSKHILPVESRGDIRTFVKSRLSAGWDFERWRESSDEKEKTEGQKILERIENSVVEQAGNMYDPQQTEKNAKIVLTEAKVSSCKSPTSSAGKVQFSK
ncbi:pfs domain-containing protein [Phyllosticta capitalensis]